MPKLNFRARYILAKDCFEIILGGDPIYMTEAEFFDFVDNWPNSRVLQVKFTGPGHAEQTARLREYFELVKEKYIERKKKESY